MSKPSPERTGWVIAAVVLIAGIAFSAYEVRRTPRRVEKLRERLASLEELRGIQDSTLRNRAAIRTFEGLAQPRAIPLQQALREIIPDVPAEVRARETASASAGWTVRRVDITMKDVRLEQVARFMYYAETQRPPWRVHEINIVASERKKGMGRVTLVMEALEKIVISDR